MRFAAPNPGKEPSFAGEEAKRRGVIPAFLLYRLSNPPFPMPAARVDRD
jgi:hypothetical protein